MTLFEIELDSKFKILNSSAFLDYKEFREYYNLNNLSNNEDDFTDFISDKFLYTSCLGTEKGNYGEIGSSFNSLVEHLKFGVKQQSEISKTITLYPEWLLFYIAIKKIKKLSILEQTFLKYVDIFHYICCLRNKNYIIRNTRNFLLIHEYSKMEERQKELNNIFLESLDPSKFTIELLRKFLRFLYINLHLEFKKQEKYKLMWNTEVYITETILLLRDKGVSTEEVYKEVGGGTYSELHNVYKYYPLYIKESNKHFENIFMPKIKNIFPESTIEDVMNYLTNNKKYENIIMSYLEVIKYLNANKPNELVMGAMIRNMVLEVEEIIKGKNDLVSFLKSIALNKEDFQSKKVNRGDCKTGQEYLEKTLDFINEKETFDKYLLIYHTVRNYLAHHNINMDDFFWSNNKIIASSTINAVIIILYRVEMKKNA